MAGPWCPKMKAMFLANPFRWTDPGTWPWTVYVWFALILAGWLKPLWRWFQRNRANSWPTASGQIESSSVDKSNRFFPSKSWRGSPLPYVAELGYSYSVAGNACAGFYRRDFGTEEEAWEFVRDLKGKSVSVQYNPNRPSTSTLSEPSIATLLRARAPTPAAESFTSAYPGSVPQWLEPFVWVFVGLSAVGLMLSLWVHGGALQGRRVAPEAFFWILHIGMFVVCFPALFVAKQRVGNLERKDFWKAVLQGSPGWMRYMVYGFLGYAIVNFALFMLKVPAGGRGASPPVDEWRGFSGHWMAFYSAALAILYSAASEHQHAPRCVNGHPVPPNANFCTRCGQPVMHS
jgi:Protein of unknown function (DUF3592)